MRASAYCSGCSSCGCRGSATDYACSLADKSERRMSSFGARAASVLMRGAQSGGLVLMGFNAWPPCEQKIAPEKGAAFYLL